MPSGGNRPGSGRPKEDPSGEKRDQQIKWITKTEKEALMAHLEYLRSARQTED